MPQNRDQGRSPEPDLTRPRASAKRALHSDETAQSRSLEVITILHEPPALLITDDDRAIRETLREVFESQGFHTVLAADGQEAVEIVQTTSVHLAVVDFHMPKLNGLQVVRRLHELEVPVPCILISAALDDSLVQQALEADVFSVEPKPLSLSHLRRLVNQAMRQTYDWPAQN